MPYTGAGDRVKTCDTKLFAAIALLLVKFKAIAVRCIDTVMFDIIVLKQYSFNISAAYLLSAMDRTADPCHDFFQYACGSWVIIKLE